MQVRRTEYDELAILARSVHITRAFRDSVVGYLIVRSASHDTVHALWEPVYNSSKVPCTLLLKEREMGAFNRELFDADFVSFWNRFRAAIRDSNAREVEDMIHFPLTNRSCMRVDWMGEKKERLGRGEFLRNFRKIFDMDRREDIFAHSPLEIQVHTDYWDIHKVVKELPELPVLHSYTFYEGGEGITQTFAFAKIHGRFKLVYCTCAG